MGGAEYRVSISPDIQWVSTEHFNFTKFIFDVIDACKRVFERLEALYLCPG